MCSNNTIKWQMGFNSAFKGLISACHNAPQVVLLQVFLLKFCAHFLFLSRFANPNLLDLIAPVIFLLKDTSYDSFSPSPPALRPTATIQVTTVFLPVPRHSVLLPQYKLRQFFSQSPSTPSYCHNTRYDSFSPSPPALRPTATIQVTTVFLPFPRHSVLLPRMILPSTLFSYIH